MFPLLTTLENVRLAAQAALGGTLRLWRRASRVRRRWSGPRAALARVGLEARAAQPAGGLSHGDKRRLEIAMLLAADKPRAPARRADGRRSRPSTCRELVELIRSVHAEEGRTVLMVEHHMEVVTGLAQRIAVMHHGALLACDTPAAVMANETVQSAYLGEAL